MELAIILARVFGAIYLAVGLGMLFNGSYYRKMMKKIMDEMGMIYFGGAVALSAGVAIISYHNVWVNNWTVIITILGWAAVIKGISLLVFPRQMVSFSKAIFDTRGLMAVAEIFVLAIGLVLGYFGFIA